MTCAAIVTCAALASGASGCSVGEGQGEISGRLIATDCEIEEREYLLQPTFFTAEVTADQLNLRVQRGSDLESYSDGLIIHVRDVNDIQSMRIGLPIVLEGEHTDVVQVVLHLNETCKTGFPNDFELQPLVLPAVSGTIRFDAVYAPDLDAASTSIQAELIDVHFADRDSPEERNATLSGAFSFFYQRGAPAQRFP